jgi:hypothetical protein
MELLDELLDAGIENSMSSEWRVDYKGYGIVPGAGWATSSPYVATFSITAMRVGGEIVLVYVGQCDGTFETDEDAWNAATNAARQVIDTFPAFPLGGLPTVKTRAGEGILICHAVPIPDGHYRGHIAFAGVGHLPQGHLCDRSDATVGEALERATALAQRLYPTR